MKTDHITALDDLTPEEQQAKLEEEAIFESFLADRRPKATPKPAKITPPTRKDIINQQLDEAIRQDLAALPTRTLPDELIHDLRKTLKRKGAKIGMLKHIVSYCNLGDPDDRYSLSIVVFLPPPKERKQKQNWFVAPIDKPKATVLWHYELRLSPHSRHHAVVGDIQRDRWAAKHYSESLDTVTEIDLGGVGALTTASNASIVDYRSEMVRHNESARMRREVIAQRSGKIGKIAQAVNRRYRSRDEAYEAEDPHWTLHDGDEDHWQIVDLSQDCCVPVDYTAMIEAMS